MLFPKRQPASFVLDRSYRETSRPGTCCIYVGRSILNNGQIHLLWPWHTMWYLLPHLPKARQKISDYRLARAIIWLLLEQIHSGAVYVVDPWKILFFCWPDEHSLIDETPSSWLFPLLLPVPTQGNEPEFFSMVFANEAAIIEASVVENFVRGCGAKAFVPFWHFWSERMTTSVGNLIACYVQLWLSFFVRDFK